MIFRKLLRTILVKFQLVHPYNRIYVYRLPYYRYLQRQRLREVRKRGEVNVMFVVPNLPMWRAQGLLDLLRLDKRFNLFIVAKSPTSFTEKENQRNVRALRDFFSEQGVFFNALIETEAKQLLDQVNPDVVFYTQPPDMSSPNSEFVYLRDRLHAYIPYGFMSLNKSWNYNLFFHNIAWRFYLPTELHLKTARIWSDCKGENVRIVGEPHADDFIYGEYREVWHCGSDKKRIIWAPHFQINHNGMFNRPSFIWTCDVMVEIAKLYKDRIHFAFKPHPRLYSELCNHPDWGEAKTKAYYDLWNAMPNSQVETGGFINLFKGSDALIHDCGSFLAEYMFVTKPCMFVTHNEKSAQDDLCEFGQKCFGLHSVGHNKDEIIRFIEDVVLKGKDEKRHEREEFFNQYLVPPNGMTTARNIYNDMCMSLFGDKY